MNNINCEIKRLERGIRRLKKKTDKMEKRILNELDRSHDNIKNAIIQKLSTKNTKVGYNQVFRIDQETGEICDILLYFEDYDKMYKIRWYLEAYLITNRDVLEESQIGELEGLIRYFM